ncbi:hypothetical protein [Marinobacter salarius]
MGNGFDLHEMENTEVGSVTIDGAEIQTFTYTLTGVHIQSITAGTTGFMGGDRGHGGRTYLKIKDHGSTDLKIKNPKSGLFEETSSIEISLGGDAELNSTIALLEYAVKVLKSQTKLEVGL